MTSRDRHHDQTGEREIVVRVRGLRTQFGTQVVHNNLDLDVFRGEVIGVVGGSGTGKSVLLKAIIGLMDYTEGTIEIFGQDIKSMSADDRVKARRQWGVLFQDAALFTSLTVAQNIQVPMREHYSMPQELMNEIAGYKISMVGLSPDAGPKYPAELSGGMRKRAGLARALALDPELLLLDEPTAGLDPIGAAAFDRLLRQLTDTLGLTVFLVTHDLDTLHTVCDRVAVLADKKVIVAGSLKEVLAFDHPWVHDYFHGPRSRAATTTTQD